MIFYYRGGPKLLVSDVEISMFGTKIAISSATKVRRPVLACQFGDSWNLTYLVSSINDFLTRLHDGGHFILKS